MRMLLGSAPASSRDSRRRDLGLVDERAACAGVAVHIDGARNQSGAQRADHTDQRHHHDQFHQREGAHARPPADRDQPGHGPYLAWNACSRICVPLGPVAVTVTHRPRAKGTPSSACACTETLAP
jgi:hypothetical protein